jgi:HK97 family phage major capsid protein
MNLQELQVRLQEKLTKQEALLKLTDAESRDFTEVENTEFDTLTNEVNGLQKDIQNEQKKEQARANIAMAKMSQVKKTEEQKVTESFSLTRAIKLKSEGRELDGAEAEVHQEAVREAGHLGRGISGFGLPASMVQVQNTRAGQDAATAATAGNLIATNLDSNIIPALRPKLIIESLGATIANGLVGNVDLPAADGIATAVWETEMGSANQTDPTTRLVELRPNRLAAYTTISKQLLIQTNGFAESWIRSELSNAVARAVDSAAIEGNASNILGILGTSGTSEISFSGAPTRAKLIDLQTYIAVENADMGNLAYLMNPRTRGGLQSLETDSGSGLFVMPNPNELLGYRVGVSTLVPTDLDPGGNKTCVIFGNWADMVVANWGGTDLIIDPYTAALTGQIRVIINSFWDVKLKQPKSFAWGADATYGTLS